MGMNTYVGLAEKLRFIPDLDIVKNVERHNSTFTSKKQYRLNQSIDIKVKIDKRFKLTDTFFNLSRS